MMDHGGAAVGSGIPDKDVRRDGVVVEKPRVTRGRIIGMDSVEIHGPFDFNTPELDELVRRIVGEGKRDLVLDLRKTSYLTALGIASVIKALKKLRKANGRLYVYGAADDMKELLEATGLAKYLASPVSETKLRTSGKGRIAA